MVARGNVGEIFSYSRHYILVESRSSSIEINLTVMLDNLVYLLTLPCLQVAVTGAKRHFVEGGNVNFIEGNDFKE